jgi:hypothetical protein
MVKRTAERFYAAWITLLGSPKFLIANRDKLWKELCQMLRVDLCLKTAYRPQSDGRSEKLNKTIVQMISHTLKNQRQWLKALPLV